MNERARCDFSTYECPNCDAPCSNEPGHEGDHMASHARSCPSPQVPLNQEFSTREPGPMLPWVLEAMPRVLPSEWRETPNGFHHEGRLNGRWYENDRRALRVGLSAAVELDGKRWLHMSIAHRDRLPTWSEIVSAKEAFLGRDRKAIQVLPPRAQWVNIHAQALHLFACVDDDPLPDFTRGSGSL